MGIYEYNCYKFCNNNSFGGSVYVSGTTCDGIVQAYTLNYGECICMDTDFPLITCENPIFSGECVPNTPTPTMTPSSTPINIPACLDQINVALSFSPVNTEYNGTYTRVSSNTGGTFNYGWIDNTTSFNTGTSPDGNNYLVYVRNVGATAYTLTNYYFVPSSTTRYYSFFKTEGSLVNNQVITNYGGIIGYTGITQGTTYVLSPGTQPGIAGTTGTFTYPVPCVTPTNTTTPTNTKTPTPTPTITRSPNVTPTNTATPTTTPTNTATPSPTPPPSLRMVPAIYECGAENPPSLEWTITYSGITYPLDLSNGGSQNPIAACVPVAYPQVGMTYSFQANVDPGCGACTGSTFYNYDRIDYEVVSYLGDYLGLGLGWSANTRFYSGGTEVFNDFSGSSEDVLYYLYPSFWPENPDNVLSGCSQPILYTQRTIGYPQFAFSCVPQPTPTNTATPTTTPSVTPTNTNTATPTTTIGATPSNTPSNTASPTTTPTSTSTPMTTGTPTTTPTSTTSPTPSGSAPQTLCIDITTNNSLDIQITQVIVDGLIASVTGGSLPNTPGNGTNLEVTLSPGNYDLDIAYNCSIPGQRISIVSPTTGYACQNTSTGSGVLNFNLVGFTALTCLQITAEDGTC